MFVEFFYLLRDRGLKISLNEWMTLLLGLEKGLHGSTLTGFYQLLTALTRCFWNSLREFRLKENSPRN